MIDFPLYREQFRPQFHFSPAEHWMNDPNGLIHVDGVYHMFFQYHPHSSVWGPMHWGHAVSRDLLRWEEQPIALFPDALGNIFSGCTVIDPHNSSGLGSNAMIAVFTYHNDDIWKAGRQNTESQGLAFSLDGGILWEKFRGNPVLKNFGEKDFRDPKVFFHAESQRWVMLLAAGDRIKFFSSTDLIHWQFESDFLTESESAAGVWECPDLFAMTVDSSEDLKWVLIVSHGSGGPNGGSGTRYFVGTFDGRRFSASQSAQWLDHGTDLYAAATFANTTGVHPIMIAWMSNWKYAAEVPTGRWRGAMTLPRELQLVRHKNKYLLSQSVISGFSALMGEPTVFPVRSSPFTQEFHGSSERIFRITTERPGIPFTFILSNDSDEQYILEYDGTEFRTDRRTSGLTDFSTEFASVQVLSLGTELLHSLEIIIDRSSAEIFINNGIFSMTNLIFPRKPLTRCSILSNEEHSSWTLTVASIDTVWK